MKRATSPLGVSGVVTEISSYFLRLADGRKRPSLPRCALALVGFAFDLRGRASLRAIATACFCGLPAARSLRIFSAIVSLLVPFLSGIVSLLLPLLGALAGLVNDLFCRFG